MEAPPVQYARTSDGYDIAYTVEGRGPPAIWLPTPFHHVLGMRRLRFHSARIAWSAERWRFIQYDQRGQGLSTRGLKPRHRWQHYLLDLDAVIERLGLESVTLIAPGASASVAIAYAAAHPEGVTALILFNPNVGAMEGERNPAAMAGLAAEDWEYFLEAIAYTDAAYEDHPLIKDVFRTSAAQADFLLWQRSFLDQDVASHLAEVTVPTLVMASPAESSAVATPLSSRMVAAGIPGARLVELDGYPGDARPAVESFVRSLQTVPWTPDSGLGETMLPALLSQREKEILRLVAAGLTNREIASELVISVRTVARHITNLYAKIGVRGKAEATAYALRRGLD